MQTGSVGLGAMGAHMARNLRRAGLLTGVWNRTAGKATALAQELECHAFTSLTELAGNCEAVVICVSADDDLRAVIAGLEPGLRPAITARSEEHTSELQSHLNLVCRLLLEKKKI